MMMGMTVPVRVEGVEILVKMNYSFPKDITTVFHELNFYYSSFHDFWESEDSNPK